MDSLANDIDVVCRLTGLFKLRSGQMSPEYFDKYLFESDPRLLSLVAVRMSKLVPEETEYLAGLEMGGIPLVTALSICTGLPVLYVRKKAKEHGTAKLIEGPNPAGCNVTLVEDVITTGGAVRDAAFHLRYTGAIVDTVICAIDRSPVDEFPLRDIYLNVVSVLTKEDLDQARNKVSL